MRYKEKREECLTSMRKWAANNPERSREIKTEWRDRNKDTVRDYARYRRAFFPAEIAAANAKYKEANPDVYTAAAAKRRATLLNATPSWTDFETVGLFYEFAALLSEATGEPHEVDHIIPLQGEFVSGLHVENNLRVISRAVNRAKSNKLVGEQT